MRCLACDVILTEPEQERKYKNHEEIKNPEHKYIGLCNKCYKGAMFDDELESHEDLDLIITDDDYE